MYKLLPILLFAILIAEENQGVFSSSAFETYPYKLNSFQFSVDGAKILEAKDGSGELAYFTVSVIGNQVLGYASSNNIIRNRGILISLVLDNKPTGLSNISIAPENFFLHMGYNGICNVLQKNSCEAHRALWIIENLDNTYDIWYDLGGNWKLDSIMQPLSSIDGYFSTKSFSAMSYESKLNVRQILNEFRKDIITEINGALLTLLNPEKFAVDIDLGHTWDLFIIDSTYITVKTIVANDKPEKVIIEDKVDNFIFEETKDSLYTIFAEKGFIGKTWINSVEGLVLIIAINPVIYIKVDNSLDIDAYNSIVITLINKVINEPKKAFPKPKFPINYENHIYITSVDIDSFRNANEKGGNTISLSRDDIYDNSWAVIIGIDKYKYSKQLNYAVKDAEAVKEMLINKFDYPEGNIRYLTDEEATLSNIKLNLGEVATSAGEDDRILVFYSGHGETLKGADGSEKGYIIPYEGRQDNPFGTGFAMDEILTTSQMSKSKHMLFLMDACYSGLMTEKSKGLSQPQEQGYLSKVANEKARQIITAGGRDEQVIERDEWQHSAFTKNLLAGLDDWEADYNNDSYITADELSTYLREHVTVDSDFQQTPQDGRFRNSGGGEFVFFSNHNAINQNVEDKSADAKLDYLISEMEELKSQKSSDDKVVEKAVNVNSSWFEKYGYEGRSIGFVALEDMYQIGIVEDLNEDWLFSIMYSHLGNKSIKNIITLHNSHSAKANALSVNLAYKYFLTERIVPFITGGAVYMMTSWEDTVQKTSGDKNVILFSGGSAVGVSLYQFEHPFPIFVGMQIGIMGAYLPMSYEFDEGIVTLDDWQIRFLPQFAFSIGIPK